MAGRPRKMAEQVGLIELLALDLSCEMAHATPKQYRGLLKPPTDTPALLWVQANRACMRACDAVQDLGDALRARAGIEGPGPASAKIDEITRRLGISPDDDDVAAETAPRARTREEDQADA